MLSHMLGFSAFFCQGSSGPDDIFEEDKYSPSSLSSSTSSIPPIKSVCAFCGQDIVDRYLLKVTRSSMLHTAVLASAASHRKCCNFLIKLGVCVSLFCHNMHMQLMRNLKVFVFTMKATINQIFHVLQLHMRPSAINKYLFLTVAIRIFVTSGRYDTIIEAIGV